MGCVKQDSSAWHLQGNSFWRDQAKGWLLSPPKDQANTPTVFIFNFVFFVWQKEKRERKKNLKKGIFIMSPVLRDCKRQTFMLGCCSFPYIAPS